MKIDLSNAELINTGRVYLHDGILSYFVFDRMSKSLRLDIESEGAHEGEKKAVKMDFINVACFEMTACDFWGVSPHILDFEYMEESERQLLPQLMKELEGIKENIPLKDSCKNLMETRITFTSGDRLIIVCESIAIQNDSSHFSMNV